jgi:hypothetical protein
MYYKGWSGISFFVCVGFVRDGSDLTPCGVHEQSLEQVQKFLGVEPRKLESLQVKIHTRPLSQQIQNWDEVLVRLKGTKFESFLDEEDHPIPP